MQKVNKLQNILPEMLLADTIWLTQQGYSGVQASKYTAAGWLHRPARGVYMRPGGRLCWQGVVVSLQTLIGAPFVVGGLAALEMQGYAHFIYPKMPGRIYLHGCGRPPGWVRRLSLDRQFIFRGVSRLFPAGKYCAPAQRCIWLAQSRRFSPSPRPAAAVRQTTWSEKDFALQISAPERAMLELLDEVPANSVADADTLVAGMRNLNWQLLQELLKDCTSVKVKRLALCLLNRHHPRLLDHIDPQGIDLGSGNRVLVKNGFLDKKYRITLPLAMKDHAGS